MDQTLITVLRYSITYYQKDLFICTQYANKHKAMALHKAYWLPCYSFNANLNFSQILNPHSTWTLQRENFNLAFLSGLWYKLLRTNVTHIDLHFSPCSSPCKKNFEKSIVLNKILQLKVRDIH